MGPKTSRKNVRMIELPTDTPTEFELRDTAAGIQRRGQERERRERGGGGINATEEVQGEGGSQEGGNATVTDRGGSNLSPQCFTRLHGH